ncbi:MAG: hypothetical protein ACXV3V_08520 [Actinomycetes bacterium]
MATIEAFATGAILAMRYDAMMPEELENGGSSVGLVTRSASCLPSRCYRVRP